MNMGKDIRSVRLLLAAVFALVCVIASVPSDAEITGPCAETITKYCKDVTPGGGRIMKCLSDHRDDQSIACKDWLEDQNKSLKDLNSACAEEIAKMCSFDKPDSMRIYQCLNDNYVSTKLNCREKLREIKDRMQ
jgi:ABC-type microcin C transport system permease subunit YejB